MGADQQKLIKIFWQAAQNWWEGLRDVAWIVAGIILLALAVIFLGSIVWLFRHSGKLVHWNLSTRRRALEAITPDLLRD